MSNMSYCRFQNTLGDLRDCLRTMQGEDEYYQVKKDLSDEEYQAMRTLIVTCQEIVDLNESEENILEREGDRKCIECEGRGTITIFTDGSGDAGHKGYERITCPTCNGTGDYTDD